MTKIIVTEKREELNLITNKWEGYSPITKPFTSSKEAGEYLETRKKVLAAKGFKLETVGDTLLGKKSEYAVCIEVTQEKLYLNEGYYTVVNEDGSHVTFKVTIPDKGSFEGKTILAYLAGRNNETDYKGFAFFDQERRTVSLWRRCSHLYDKLIAASVLAGAPHLAGEKYALESGRCYLCNRTLTVPSSISTGVGPECAKKL